jgi:hypothetical protein
MPPQPDLGVIRNAAIIMYKKFFVKHYQASLKERTITHALLLSDCYKFKDIIECHTRKCSVCFINILDLVKILLAIFFTYSIGGDIIWRARVVRTSLRISIVDILWKRARPSGRERGGHHNMQVTGSACLLRWNEEAMQYNALTISELQ